METIFCECKKCDAPIGRFSNLWTQIGKSYFSPVVEPEDDLAVKCKGNVRIGERGTLVEECRLQDIVCGNCAALLGLRCIETPVNHVLDENQLLLRLASVDLLDSEGQEIEFAIKRVLSVNEPSRVRNPNVPGPSQGAGFASSFPSAVQLQQLQTDLRNQKEDIKRIDSNGFRIVSVLDKRTSRIEAEVMKQGGALDSFNLAIEGLRKELVSIKEEDGKASRAARGTTTLAALEGRVASLNRKCEEVTTLSARLQQDIHELKSKLSQQHQDIEHLRSEIRGSITTAEHAEDMASVRVEMAQMRRQMEEAFWSRGTGWADTAFPSKELEVLTSNIAKIGNRASQVETLQMELEILKGRHAKARRLLRP
ncbi:hypothetical protein VTI74DRAFT_3634 [Chaetomium olivicolor]